MKPRLSHFNVLGHIFCKMCLNKQVVGVFDVYLLMKSLQRIRFDLVVRTLSPQFTPLSPSQPAKGGGEAGHFCHECPPWSDGGDGAEGSASGGAAEGTESAVQGAGLPSQGVGRAANSDPESGAEGRSEPQRGPPEPDRAGQSRGHTGHAASTRGGEE